MRLQIFDNSMKNAVLAYQYKILQKVSTSEALTGRELMLDVGCDNGAFSQLFSKYVKIIVGLDVVSNPNWRNIKSKNVQFLIADACYLPFRRQVFDLIFAKDVLHHIRNHPKALKEIARVMRREGTAIIVEANRWNPICYFHMTLMKRHQHFSKQYFKDLIKSVFGECHFMSFETHVYPVRSMTFLRLINILEALLEKMRIFNYFLSYTIAIAKNKVVES